MDDLMEAEAVHAQGEPGPEPAENLLQLPFFSFHLDASPDLFDAPICFVLLLRAACLIGALVILRWVRTTDGGGRHHAKMLAPVPLADERCSVYDFIVCKRVCNMKHV